MTEFIWMVCGISFWVKNSYLKKLWHLLFKKILIIANNFDKSILPSILHAREGKIKLALTSKKSEF